MRVNQWLLYHIHAHLLALLVLSVFIGVTIGALFVIRKYIPFHKLKLHNDVAGFIFATIGVIYAVLLAFTVIVTWENYEKADRNAVAEANCIDDLYRDAEGFPTGFKDSVRSTLEEYASAIVNEEWKTMAFGKRGEKTQAVSEKLWRLYSSFNPETDRESAFFEKSIDKLNDAAELRKERLLAARTGIPRIMWNVLIGGGLITILFTGFFGSENFTAQMIMSSLLSALVAFSILTIMALDYPFTGSVSISPDTFKMVLTHFNL